MPVSAKMGCSASRAPVPTDAFGGAVLIGNEEDMSCSTMDWRGGRKHPI